MLRACSRCAVLSSAAVVFILFVFMFSPFLFYRPCCFRSLVRRNDRNVTWHFAVQRDVTAGRSMGCVRQLINARRLPQATRIISRKVRLLRIFFFYYVPCHLRFLFYFDCRLFRRSNFVTVKRWNKGIQFPIQYHFCNAPIKGLRRFQCKRQFRRTSNGTFYR